MRSPSGSGGWKSRTLSYDGRTRTSRPQPLFRSGTRPPSAALIRFIDTHRDRLGVEPIYRTLAIAVSTYYAAKRRPPAARAVRDAEPTTHRDPADPDSSPVCDELMLTSLADVTRTKWHFMILRAYGLETSENWVLQVQ